MSLLEVLYPEEEKEEDREEDEERFEFYMYCEAIETSWAVRKWNFKNLYFYFIVFLINSMNYTYSFIVFVQLLEALFTKRPSRDKVPP